MTVRVVDEQERLVPHADNTIQFAIEGPGEIVVTDNGDPTSFEMFTSQERKSFNGVALVIVRENRGDPGEIELTASNQGLHQAAVEVKAIP